MTTTLRHWWEWVRTSYWFVPSQMVVLAIAMAGGMVTLDETLGPRTGGGGTWSMSEGRTARARSSPPSPIRWCARDNAVVTIRLLETLAVIASRARGENDRQAVLHHARMVERGSRDGLREERDRADVRQRVEMIVRALRPARQRMIGTDA